MRPLRQHVPYELKDAAALPSIFAASRLARPALIVGAWVSTQSPSGIPDAYRWKRALIHGLALAAEWPEDPTRELDDEAMATLRQANDLKLERVLEALERAQPGVAARLISQAVDGRPNQLHRHVAALLRRGRMSSVVNLNFDELLEKTRGRPLRVWTTGEPIKGDSEVLHVHGRAGDPDSLRHILARFSERLPDQEHRFVSAALDGEVVTMGWAATDPDILAALREGSGEVHTLIAGDEPDPVMKSALHDLARFRKVTAYKGGLARYAMGGGAHYTAPNQNSFERSLSAIVRAARSIDRVQARRAYVWLHFEFAIAHGADHSHILDQWAAVLTPDKAEQTLLRISIAEHQQALGHSVRAAAINYRIFRETRDPSYLSEVGDVLERSLRGLNPLNGLTGWVIHRRAVALYQSRGGSIPIWPLARLARANLRIGRRAVAAEMLDELIAALKSERQQDLWVHGHLLRLRALARASEGGDAWRSDLEAAERLFAFAARPLEQGSVLRAAALCEMLQGAPGWKARSLGYLDRVAPFYRISSDASAWTRLRAQRLATTRLPRRVGAWVLTHL